MWTAFLKIFLFLQKALPLQVLYDPERKRFIETSKLSKRYWYIFWQVAQAWIVASFRMLNYLRSEPGKIGMTFIDFILDLLLWALCFLNLCCCWSFYRKSHYLCFALNQYLAQWNGKGK